MQHPSFEPYASPGVDAAPPPPGASIRFGDAVRFSFRAERPWMNILVSTVLSMIPIAGAIAIGGWHAEIMQRLVRRHPTPIPTLDFSDFMHYLTRGVQPFIARVLVALPISLVATFGMIVAFIGGGVAARTGDPTFVFVVYGIVMGLLVLMAPLFTILFCAVYTRADLTEEMGQALSFSKLTAYMRLTWATALWTFFLFWFISFGLTMLGLIACYFGLFVSVAVVQLAQLHLRWQIYERYIMRGGEPITLKPAMTLPSEQARANPYAPYPHQPQQPPPPPYVPPPQYPPG